MHTFRLLSKVSLPYARPRALVRSQSQQASWPSVYTSMKKDPVSRPTLCKGLRSLYASRAQVDANYVVDMHTNTRVPGVVACVTLLKYLLMHPLTTLYRNV